MDRRISRAITLIGFKPFVAFAGTSIVSKTQPELRFVPAQGVCLFQRRR